MNMENLTLIAERIQVALLIAWFIPTLLMMVLSNQRSNCTSHFGGTGSPREPILLGMSVILLKLVLVIEYTVSAGSWPWFYAAVFLFAQYETKLWTLDEFSFQKQKLPHYELIWAVVLLCVYLFG